MTSSPPEQHPASSTATAGSAPSWRVDGLDLARFLALIGMMGTHLWLSDAEGATIPLTGALEGKAASLFAVLAGVGIVLATRRHLDAGDARAARLALFGRGAALIVIGLVLGMFSFYILVILTYYGVLFWLLIPFVRLRARWLLIAAAVWAIVWPFCSHGLRLLLATDDWPIKSPNLADLLSPHLLVTDLLLTGTYPAIAWMVYGFVGMAIGKLIVERVGSVGVSGTGTAAAFSPDRGPLRRLGAQLALWGGGVAALVTLVNLVIVRYVYLPTLGSGGTMDDGAPGGLMGGDWESGAADPAQAQQIELESLRENAYGTTPTDSLTNLLSTGPHTSTPFDLLITAGVAMAVIGVCIIVASFFGRLAGRILLPVLGAGAAPLTVYAVHVVLTTALRLLAQGSGAADSWLASSWQIWLVNILVALAIGAAIRLARMRGPLESLVTASGRWAAGLRGARRGAAVM
ncbi:heparan-alpha-glucosaminide N-acetyltransferase domain-containing protein [Pseudoclavibacter endophyticus]|uniref:DUF1624 domain-containing protein n=1 Tax=Pseudoclavibacter endophyticus TaxID=1778590 RepID=A0A6H9WS12_9MICO|nr:heparan-alpha-glucosaminide N-acetyltransferase domain-containing protein [Pseudoclavibacter endophyticus]KAB1650411.1 DUF1624 domain-containing protein [Pseudoclavibacter endophyticus]